MMKHFAIDNSIRTGESVPAGAVELTETEYRQTLDAMIAGQEVIVIDGALVVRDRVPSPDHTWKDGQWVAPPDPEPEPPTLDDYRAAIKAHVDAVARERDYGSAVSATSYILPDPNDPGVTPEEQKWDAEGRAVQRWRNAVWKVVFAELAKVLAGDREQPTVDELIAELPTIEWPE